MTASTAEFAFYYPNVIWRDGNWVKNLILFFDGIALLVPNYIKEKPTLLDPAIVAGLEQHGLLHIIEPEKAVDKEAATKLAEALTDIITSGVLDDLSKGDTAFHEISHSRLGSYGDPGLAEMIFEELKARKLARDSEDGVSIPMHPTVRSLILVLLAQILRPYGKHLNAELSPATDRPMLVDALSEILGKKPFPSMGSVIQFDTNAVGIDLGSVPIDEVLDFRKQNYAQHRLYCLSARRFAQELSLMGDEERALSFELRQAELDQIGSDLRNRARKAWRKPAAFSLTLASAAMSLTTGHPLAAAAFSLGAATLGYSSPPKPQMDSYSYLFSAHERYPY